MESAFSPRRVGADERCGNRLPLGPRLDCPATVKLRFALQLDGGFSELPLFGAEVKCRCHVTEGVLGVSVRRMGQPTLESGGGCGN